MRLPDPCLDLLLFAIEPEGPTASVVCAAKRVSRRRASAGTLERPLGRANGPALD